MTQNPDGSNPEDTPEGGPTGHGGEGNRKLDEDAAWRAIVENYGDEPPVDEYYTEAPTAGEPAAPSSAEDPPPGVLERGWNDPHQTEATWDDEGHFVPPVPPPMPKLEPRRKLAWIGLFGAPALMLVAVVFGWQYPGWLGFLLVAGFLGGFGYLVATMPRSRPEDGSGDDGAVV
jgi:hypothetical protein